MAVVQNILANDFLVQIIYPFLLIFTLIFAILEKTKILGDEKHQVNALTSLAIALIAVAFSWATGIITKLMPFLAVSVVIILVLMILYGFVATGPTGGFTVPNWMKYGLAVVIIIAVIIAVIVATGQWGFVYNSLFVSGTPTGWFTNILLLAIIIGAIAIVLTSGKKGSSSS
ncbi:MAG: hypothetical protein WC533_04235 [Candidatus Pacearchaeota archaeon]